MCHDTIKEGNPGKRDWGWRMATKTVCGALALLVGLVILTSCDYTSRDESGQPWPQSQTPQPPQTSPQKPGAEVIQLAMSGKGRITTISATTQDLQALADDNMALASDLYAALRTREGNFLFSPYSVSQALAPVYAGAKGETEGQIARTIHFTLPQDRLNPAFNALNVQLAQRGENATGKDGETFRLNVVNAIWGQRGYAFLPQYLDILAEYYGAGIRLLDFVKAPEPSRTAINEWVSEQTENRVEDLLPAGSVSSLTRLVVTNAVYFNAAWERPFNKASTRAGIFHLLDGSQKNVSMMKQIESFGYCENSHYQAVELPYSGGELSMVIVLPREGEFEAFEESLDQPLLSNIQEMMASRQVALSMPQFEFDSSLGLNKILSEMGMPAAFSDAADFSGMTGNRDLRIAEVLHRAFISVDEAGTEAAAATGVVMAVVGLPESPIEMTVDSPFIFFIQDIKTRAILFIGRVLDPDS